MRRELGPRLARALAAALLAALAATPAGAESAPPPAAAQPLMSWDDYVDLLKPLGQRMLDRLPERLRDDPQTREEVYMLLLAGLVRGSTDALVGDPDRPMFVPDTNITLNLFQPNADTIYKSAVIDGAGTYRIAGERGSTLLMTLAELGPDPLISGKPNAPLAQYDFDSLHIGPDGRFEVILSAQRPAGYSGDWWRLDARAEKLFMRQVAYRWGVEREPRLGIERLDRPPMRPRLSAEALSARLRQVPLIAGNAAGLFLDHVEGLRRQGYVNRLKPVDFSQMSGLAKQAYYEGAYDLGPDEALLIEVKVPEPCRYWSLILTNEIYETTDWYNNQSTLNGAQARLDPDGWFRAVVSARDPGTPNWLDTSGYPKGAIQGRWMECADAPTPSVRKLPVSEVRKALPPGTPVVTPQAREQALRERRLQAQMRTLW